MNKFKDDDGCCCCDQIGLSQIIRNEEDWSGPIGTVVQLLDGELWAFEGGLIQYPGESEVGNPCKGEPAELKDQPARPKSHFILTSLLKWEFKAESCVICLKGIEGPRYFSSWGLPGETRYVFYDCVKWRFSVARQADGSYSIDNSYAYTGPPSQAAWVQAFTRRARPQPDPIGFLPH